MIHGKQFAVLKHELNIKGYHHIPMNKGWILSISSKVPFTYNREKDILLIGYAWNIFPGKSPQKMVLSGEENLLEKEETWCGRYVLIINNTVYTDASALYGVFYNRRGIASDVRFLLDSGSNLNNHFVSSWSVADLGFFPGYHTPFGDTPDGGIKRVLPSQAYNFETYELLHRNLLVDVPDTPENMLAEAFSNIFCGSLRNMQKLLPKRRFSVALTGGYDSRTLFALMIKSGIPFDCFTLEHENMSPGDVELPKTICDITGTKYTYIKRDKGILPATVNQRSEDYKNHISGMIEEEDQRFYAYGQYSELDDAVILRSNIWETVVDYNERFVGDDGDRDIVFDYYELRKGSAEYESLNKAFDWFVQYPEDMTDTNRMHWEIRGADWVAESEHGFDIYDDLISLQPLNSRYLISFLFLFSKETRKNDEHQKAIIKLCCPEISHLPFASNTDYIKTKKDKVKRTIKRTRRRIKNIGLARTIRLYFVLMQGKAKS